MSPAKAGFFNEKNMNKLEGRKAIIYDTTSRDGGQTPDVALSVENKLHITRRLDEMGIHFIEGGWPDANPTDIKFFEQAKKLELKNSKLVAFGMTTKVGVLPENSDTLRALLQSETEFVTVFGKSWMLHVRHALGTTGKENLRIINQTIDFLAKRRRVFYDAEHFFQGFEDNPRYALKTLEAAQDGGAEVIILCDTNGGSTPELVFEATSTARTRLGDSMPLGIHVHNDTGFALANTFAAVRAGATQVQGTINGLGERAGNLDLCQFLPNAVFKYNMDIGKIDLRELINLSRFVEMESGFLMPANASYVGRNVYTHKAGVHVSAVRRHPQAYSHLDPSLVGGEMSFEHSDQGGGANVLAMAERQGFFIESGTPDHHELVRRMKELQVLGDAQEFLLLNRVLRKDPEPFDVLPESLSTSRRNGDAFANLVVRVNGDILTQQAEGNGQINGFDIALRKALERKYPQVGEVRLLHYSMPDIQRPGTDAEVIIHTTLGADGQRWTSIAKGTDQQIAGENAIIDGYKYYLLKNQMKGK